MTSNRGSEREWLEGLRYEDKFPQEEWDDDDRAYDLWKEDGKRDPLPLTRPFRQTAESE